MSDYDSMPLRHFEEEEENLDAENFRWGCLLTQIVDTGQGIENSELSELCKTFKMCNEFSSSTQREDKSKGIGLGLSTSKQLAHSLCGLFSIKSRPDHGTNVCFSVQVRD